MEQKAHGAVREKVKGRRHDEVWLTTARVLEVEREVGEDRLTLFIRQPLHHLAEVRT
ncbi:MAG TPA: hypothetical protein VGW38_19900 [Chloroflexota bacterium]|nr:hypothetical protein [Chloroflexota bacterium]